MPESESKTWNEGEPLMKVKINSGFVPRKPSAMKIR